MNHEITIEKFPYFRYIGYRAKCSCGKYTSGKHVYPGRAEQAGMDHVNAMKQVKSKCRGER